MSSGFFARVCLRSADRLIQEIAGFLALLAYISAKPIFRSRMPRVDDGTMPRLFRSLVELRSFNSAASIWSGEVLRLIEQSAFPEKITELIGGARGELFIGFRVATCLGKPRAFAAA